MALPVPFMNTGELGSPPQPGPLAAYIANDCLKGAIGTLLAEASNNPGKCISQELCQSRVHLRALSAPFLGPERQVLGTVTVFHDITSFKELDEMKNDFVRMVSANIVSDLYHATRQRVNWNRAASIFWFRTMQFWGTYLGYRRSLEWNWQLRQTFYYPQGMETPRKNTPREVEPIRYNQ